jgi:hypothetical protein
VDNAEIPETFRQIAPGYACAITIQYRLYKQTVVLAIGSNMTGTSWQQILDAFPLIIT